MDQKDISQKAGVGKQTGAESKEGFVGMFST